MVDNTEKLSLEDYLDKYVFVGDGGVEIAPSVTAVEGFNRYIENYKSCFGVEKAAVEYKKLIWSRSGIRFVERMSLPHLKNGCGSGLSYSSVSLSVYL